MPNPKQSPLTAHHEIFKAISKLNKNKLNLSCSSIELQLAAYLAAIRPFFCPELNSCKVGDKAVPLYAIDEIKALAESVLCKKDRSFNPFLVPYRVYYGKPVEDITIRSISTSDTEEPTSKRCHIEIEID